MTEETKRDLRKDYWYNEYLRLITKINQKIEELENQHSMSDDVRREVLKSLSRRKHTEECFLRGIHGCFGTDCECWCHEPIEENFKGERRVETMKSNKEIKERILEECDFCKAKGDWKNVIRSTDFEKKDGSDIIVCDSCLNFYANQEFDKLRKRLK